MLSSKFEMVPFCFNQFISGITEASTKGKIIPQYSLQQVSPFPNA